MERFTISLDEALASQFDQLIAARGYSNRSEAVRDLIRGAIESDRQRVKPPLVTAWPTCPTSITTTNANWPSA
jgi:metal-responsive CopG/Arc/MetJ family transcriptional regulator